MHEVVIIDAVRSPIGRRNGGLSTAHSAELLAQVQKGLVERVGIDPGRIGQVVGGCVQQVGMQSANVTRNAWLTAGLPMEVAATTVNTQCGSSQQATNLAVALVAGGIVEVAMGCGVEVMSRVPMGSSTPRDPDVGRSITRQYWEHHEMTSQFEGAERIAEQWDLSRDELDGFGKLSQDRAAQAWLEGRFDTQVLPVEVADPGEDGAADGRRTVGRDEGMRETHLDKLAQLKPNLPDRPRQFHTAGTSSQISDGAGAVLVTTPEAAERLAVEPVARVIGSCLVGSDPALMLTGPMPATRKLLADAKLEIDDIDVFEINEAFAAVVVAWRKELGADIDRVNPNGGAIALGHPLGGTGAILLTKAVHELQRTGGRYALVSMCCGGGLGTGTLIERV